MTQQGKPWLVLRAITSEVDADSTGFARSPEFWEMIRQRRQEHGIAWEEAQKELGFEQAETGA